MTYSRVVGIDPSLTSTGVATIYPTGQLLTSAHGRAGHRGDTIAQRLQRIRDLVDELRGYADPHTLVVIEGWSFGHKRQSGEFDRAGLWWEITRALVRADVDVALCPPAVRMTWATGKGNAKKDAVTAAAEERFRRDFDTSDEADAAVMAGIGAHALGWRDDPRYDSLLSVEWPAQVAELVSDRYHRNVAAGAR